MLSLLYPAGHALIAAAAPPFDVDSSAPPSRHPPLSPEEGAVAATNPPSLI